MPTAPVLYTDTHSHEHLDMAGGFPPEVYLTHDDEDTNSHVHPVPSQTGVNPWQLQYPGTNPQDCPAVLGPQRVRAALNDQRETVQLALLHQQG